MFTGAGNSEPHSFSSCSLLDHTQAPLSSSSLLETPLSLGLYQTTDLDPKPLSQTAHTEVELSKANSTQQLLAGIGKGI